MSPSPLRDLMRSPAGIATVLVWLVISGYGILSPGSVFVFSILPLVFVAVLALLSLFYRLVVAIEHIAYDS
ncbi:hypothetical protein [Natrinema longum]|uniref:Uncharacterized protein n=1 Tax=Natrinema longum TaxID=370324 RepID=A0A8A2UAJ1_9EURY|nr:hypothetical protein [Natrinema longum]MBZ6496413.1 hypothetical protein [Natrinema longum]QSW85680.1 hypothetical protein J0X27_02215 [Natrinema longum]